MKTFSKVLSMFLVVVMCFGLFATSAYATSGYGAFDFGDGASAGFAAPEAPAAEAASGEFTVNVDALENNVTAAAVEEQKTEQPAVQNAEQVEEPTTIQFGEVSDSATFNTPYSKMSDTVKFSATPKDINKKMADTDANVKITSSTDTFDGDTFPNIGYSTSATGANIITLVRGSHYEVNSANNLLIYGSWLKTLAPGTYFFYGLRTDDVPVKLDYVNVDNGSFNAATINPNTYDRNASVVTLIKATGGDLASMNAFGVAGVSSSYTHILGVNEYTTNAAGTELTLTERYLDSLSDGQYYLIGFPIAGSTADQVNLGKFTVRSSEVPYDWTLTPDYQVWYSGTDPLTFYSDVFAAAGEGWNYKGYKWDVIVPDIRVSTRSNMSGAASVRIDQYWDLGYGYFMLGQNFLSSLSADETYYMQVIDARSPDLIYTNVVSFRVGPTLRAIDTDKHVINSTRSLRFRSSSPVSEVYVGNIMLTDPADYGVSWDGKTVTLSFEFLNKRSAGNTYTVKVRTTDGEWAATTFQVLTTAQGSASPRTGDESNLGLWAAFLLLSGTAVVVLVPKLRKQDF